MARPKLIKDSDAISEVLHTISRKYPTRSKEYRTLMLAAHAVWYLSARKMWEEFAQFMDERNRPLTPLQEAAIRRYSVPLKPRPKRKSVSNGS